MRLKCLQNRDTNTPVDLRTIKPQIAMGDSGDEANVSVGLNFFLEKRGDLDLIAHSGAQNGFISHFFVNIPSRAAYIVAYNTDASLKTKGDQQSTRALDAALRDYFVQHMFPALRRLPEPSATSAVR